MPLTWVKKLLLLGMMMTLTWSVYQPVRRFGMLAYDDLNHIVYNPQIVQRDAPHRWRAIWQSPYFDLYIPVAYSVWAMVTDQAVSLKEVPVPPLTLAKNPTLSRALHTLNLALHSLNSGIVMAIFLLLGISPMGALLGGLLFALHPLQIESVAWISEARGLLASFFGLLALYLWLSSWKTPRPEAHRLVLQVLGNMCVVVGLLSKPSIVVIPLLSMYLGKVFFHISLRQTLKTVWPTFFACIAVALITSHLQREGLPHWSWWQRFFLVGDSLNFYVQKVLWPHRLLPDYARLPQFTDVTAKIRTLGPWTLIGLLAWQRKKIPIIWLSVMVFMLGIVSSLGFFPNLFQSMSTVADRYAYLAMLGPAIGLARGLEILRERLRPLPSWGEGLLGGCAVLFCASILGMLMRDHLPVWQSTGSLFEYTMAHNPKSFTAPHALGDLAVMNEDLPAAEKYYRQAINARPDIAQGYASLGNILLKRNRLEEARVLFEKTLSIYQLHESARVNLGVTLLRLGDIAGAEREFSAVLTSYSNAVAYFNQGLIHMKNVRRDAAITSFTEALRADPNLVQAHLYLALAYDQIGDPLKSDAHITIAAEKNPNSSKVWEVKGAIFLRRGEKDSALESFKKALTLDPTSIAAKKALGLQPALDTSPR